MNEPTTCKCDKIAKLAKEIACYWNGHKDLILSLEATSKAWVPFNNISKSCDQLFETIRNIIEDNNEMLVDDDTSSDAKLILGQALAEFACITKEISQCYDKADQWRTEEKFIQALRDLYQTVPAKILPLLEKIAEKYEKSPEEFILRPERKNFLQFFNEWLQNTKIDSVWSKDFSYFPIADFEILLLTVPLPDGIDTFIRLISNIKSPVILETLFSYVVANYAESDTLANMLIKAPVCISPDSPENIQKIDWNQSLTLPLLLKLAFENDRHPEILEQIFSRLAERSDGLFLAYHFIGHLLQEIDRAYFYNDSQPRVEMLEGKIAQLKEAFREPMQKILIDVVLPENIEKKHKAFLETGAVTESNVLKCSLLNLIRRQLILEEPLSPEKSEDIINKFEKILAIEDKEFHTSSFDTTVPEHKHYEIALLYAIHDKPDEKWHRTWKTLSSALHRLNYHPNEMSNISYKVCFCLAVGLAVADCKLQNSEFDNAHRMLSAVWQEILSLHRTHYYVYQAFIERIAPLCVTRFYVIEKQKTGKAQLSDCSETLQDLHETPRLLIKTVDILCNNGIELSINSQPPAFLQPTILLAIEQVKNDSRKQELKQHYENWLKRLSAEPEDSSQNHVDI